MAGQSTYWGDAAEILAGAGVEAVPDFYGRYTGARERAAFTVPMRLQAAVTRKDADAFADVFAENGSLVQYDDELKTREEIRAYMKAAFAGPFKDNDVAGRSLRLAFLTEDVAMLTEEAGVLLPGELKAAPERLFYATWLIHRVAPGRLELLSFHQSPIHS
jgi:uncharacterized protein (TIGR02246 family)